MNRLECLFFQPDSPLLRRTTWQCMCHSLQIPRPLPDTKRNPISQAAWPELASHKNLRLSLLLFVYAPRFFQSLMQFLTLDPDARDELLRIVARKHMLYLHCTLEAQSGRTLLVFFLRCNFSAISVKSLSCNFSWLRIQQISADGCKTGILVVTFFSLRFNFSHFSLRRVCAFGIHSLIISSWVFTP